MSVREDGKWVIGVYLGQHRDIGFDFEIKAIWVDGDTHRKLQHYLERGEMSGIYPPIPLPEGNLSAQVTVRKVSH